MNSEVKASTKITFALLLLLPLSQKVYAQKLELAVQTGHSSVVASVAYSPDGKILASGSLDKTVKLWDAASGQEILTLSGHPGGVRSVAFSPDGKRLASASDDQTIKLWDIATGQVIRTFTGHTAGVRSVAFSSDGKSLASGSEDNTVKLWNADSGRELKTFGLQLEIKHYFDYIVPVAFSPDGKALASASWDKRVWVWDVASGREPKILRGTTNKPPVATPTPPTPSVAFSPSGDVLASGSSDNTIKLWNVATGQEVKTLGGGASYFTSVTFSPDGKILAAGTRDNSVSLWEAATGQELRTLKVVDKWGWVNSIAFSPDGKSLAGASDDIRVWDVGSGRELTPPGRHAHRLDNIVFSPDGKTLAGGSSNDRTIKLWNLATGRELLTLKGHTSWILSLAFSPDGKVLASGSGYYFGADEIKLWDIATGRELKTLRGHTSAVVSVGFSPDGKLLVSGSTDYTVKVWDIASGRELHTLKGQHTMGAPVAFSRDGRLVANATYENEIVLWDVKAGTVLRKLPSQRTPPDQLTFSPDGKILASASDFQGDGEIKLWDVAARRESKVIAIRFPIDRAIRFSPDGKMLAGSSMNGDTALWDVASGQEIPLPERLPDWCLSGLGHRIPRADALAIEDGNRIKLVDAATKKEIASLIALDDSDWAVVTPEGRFDASPNGMKLMHYNYGLEAIDLQQLKERYYEPGLLAKLTGFNEEPLREVVDFKSVDLFPSAEVTRFVEDSGDLSVRLTNRGGGIGRVQVFVNDKELIADARPKGFDPTIKQATLDIDLLGAPVVEGEPNRIKVLTYNQEGYLSSRGTLLSWKPPGATASPTPELYALVAGVSDYSSPQLKLRYASKDAADMAKAIGLGAKALFGADRVHVKLLSSDKGNSLALPPTKANFRKAFEEFSRARPTDILLVYLAGHGVTLPGSDTYLYLTQEARSREGSVLSDPAVRDLTTISSNELVEWIKKVPALKQVMILDTCAAGAAAPRLVERRGITGDQIRAIERLRDRTGFHVLMGSAADSVSYEATQYGQGILTYVLLQGMSGAALRDDQFVDVQKLFQYAADGVPQLARNVGGVQRPVVAAPGGTSFDVGKLSVEDKSRIPLSKVKPLVLRPRITLQELGDDTLNIMRELRQRLRDASYFSETDISPPKFVYVDEEDLPGAIRLVGTYTVNGETVNIKLFLRRDDQTIRPLPTVEGSIRDVPALADKVFGLLTKALDDMASL